MKRYSKTVHYWNPNWLFLYLNVLYNIFKYKNNQFCDTCQSIFIPSAYRTIRQYLNFNVRNGKTVIKAYCILIAGITVGHAVLLTQKAHEALQCKHPSRKNNLIIQMKQLRQKKEKPTPFPNADLLTVVFSMCLGRYDWKHGSDTCRLPKPAQYVCDAVQAPIGIVFWTWSLQSVQTIPVLLYFSFYLCDVHLSFHSTSWASILLNQFLWPKKTTLKMYLLIATWSFYSARFCCFVRQHEQQVEGSRQVDDLRSTTILHDVLGLTVKPEPTQQNGQYTEGT